MKHTRTSLLLAGLLFLLTSCASQVSQETVAGDGHSHGDDSHSHAEAPAYEDERSAESFRSLVASNMTFDYDAFDSIDSAVRWADRTVVGSIVGVKPGLEVWIPNPSGPCDEKSRPAEAQVKVGPEDRVECITDESILFSTYLEVSVTSKDPDGTLLAMQVEVPQHAVADGVARFPIGSEVVAVLADESTWRPTEGAVFRWPDGESRTVWIPTPDGLIIEGEAGAAVAIFDDSSEVLTRWGIPGADFSTVRDVALTAIAAQ